MGWILYADSRDHNLHPQNLHFEQILKFEDSVTPEPLTGKPRKVTLKEALKYVLSVLFADALPTFFFYPLEGAYIRMITDYEPVPQFNSIIDSICKTVEQEGVLGLYRGYLYDFLKTVLVSGCEAFLFANNLANERNYVKSREETWTYHAVRFLQMICSYPLDSLRFRALVNHKAGLELGVVLFAGIWEELVYTGISVSFFALHKMVRKMAERERRARLNQ